MLLFRVRNAVVVPHGRRGALLRDVALLLLLLAVLLVKVQCVVLPMLHVLLLVMRVLLLPVVLADVPTVSRVKLFFVLAGITQTVADAGTPRTKMVTSS